MLKFDISRGATVAGMALVAISILDLLTSGSGAPGVLHAVIAGLGFALFAAAGAAEAGR